MQGDQEAVSEPGVGVPRTSDWCSWGRRGGNGCLRPQIPEGFPHHLLSCLLICPFITGDAAFCAAADLILPSVLSLTRRSSWYVVSSQSLQARTNPVMFSESMCQEMHYMGRMRPQDGAVGAHSIARQTGTAGVSTGASGPPPPSAGDWWSWRWSSQLLTRPSR